MCVSCALTHCLQVIVILPSNRKDRYDSIKKFCCIDRPVPSQCILQRTLSKKQNLMSVTTKVAMQLNCKLGGELWALEVPVSGSRVVEPLLSHLMFAHWVCWNDVVASILPAALCSVPVRFTLAHSKRASSKPSGRLRPPPAGSCLTPHAHTTHFVNCLSYSCSGCTLYTHRLPV